MPNLSRMLRGGDDSYPRKTHNGEKNPDGSIVVCKGTRKGAVHRVNPPGMGGITRMLMRKAAKEGRI